MNQQTMGDRHGFVDGYHIPNLCKYCGEPRVSGRHVLGEMTSLLEIKQRLAAIEQGQGVLCERLDKILARMEEPLNISGVDRQVVMESMAREKRIEAKLDLLQILGPLEAIHERLDTLEKMLRPKRRRK